MSLSQLDHRASSAVLRNKKGIGLICVYVVLASILVSFGPIAIARLFFLVGAGLVSYLLCQWNPALYVSFTLWLWFLNPFVRRILNLRGGWVESDPILAASLLATLACVPQVCRQLFAGRTKGTLPFVLAFAAVAYGSLVGALFIPPRQILLESAGWIAPLVFGLYVLFVYSDAERRAPLRRAFENTFRWGLLLMGLYSVVQFTVVPAWDAFWLIQTDNPAFGTPDPFGVRVFSTMASPVPLGVASFAGLILLTQQPGMVALFATVAGYGSLALCSVRSAWGLWIIGTVLIMVRQPKRLGRFLLVISSALVLLVLSTTIPQVRDVLQKRLETLSDLSNDGSYQARSSGYQDMVALVLDNPIGSGLGAMETILNGKSELGGRDSGVLEIALSLGWVGGAAYFAALAIIIYWAFKKPSEMSPFSTAAGVISVALICHIVLASISSGFDGVALWSFAGITIASHANPNEDPFSLSDVGSLELART